MVFDSKKLLRVATDNARLAPSPGDTLIALVKPDEASRPANES